MSKFTSKFKNKCTGGLIAAAVASTLMVVNTASPAGTIRIGATMRMISENGQKYGQMVADEFDLINEEGGINGNKIELTLLNDECKSDKGVANANKFIFDRKVHLIIGSTCSSVSLPIVDITAKAETDLRILAEKLRNHGRGRAGADGGVHRLAVMGRLPRFGADAID